MAFWGVEITSKKPYTHKYDPRFGRLRVAKATLGHGSSKDNSSLRCFVGPNAPVLLCSLFPERKESVSLGLEFEEEDDVLFTVVGPRSVHLCGYYVGARRPCDGDETDSYGEDIVDTDGEDDGGSKNEYDYEDSFIVDDGYESKEEEVSVEQAREGRHRRRLRKKYVMEDTDSESSLRPPVNQNKKVESSSDTESTEAFVDSFFGCSFENAVAEEKSISESAGEDNKKKSSGDVQKNRDNKTVKESPKKKKKKNKDGNAVGESGKKENSGVILKSLGNKADEKILKKTTMKNNENSYGESAKNENCGGTLISSGDKSAEKISKTKAMKNNENAYAKCDKKENCDDIQKNLGNKAEKESPKKKKKKRNEENAVGKCDKKESIVEFEKHSGNKVEESPKNKKRKNEDLGRDRILSDEALSDGSKKRKNEDIVLRG
ncbi:Peptidyl-prolyl cis-trans isomerase FKBP43 [Acorus gramineus]|uniref:peptidylprolyl isomerase n=1 Tax=Acorus gramineus TaxID=55184 RepID=A0AAV9ARF7_ACOGR|nr:Peptidyl-prolyl cis-trans isomerase FKBP43 [Acorus gramineus]